VRESKESDVGPSAYLHSLCTVCVLALQSSTQGNVSSPCYSMVANLTSSVSIHKPIAYVNVTAFNSTQLEAREKKKIE